MRARLVGRSMQKNRTLLDSPSHAGHAHRALTRERLRVFQQSAQASIDGAAQSADLSTTLASGALRITEAMPFSRLASAL